MSIFAHTVQYLKDKKYRRLQKKAHNLVTGELDLITNIKKARMLALSTISLLSSQQRIIVS